MARIAGVNIPNNKIVKVALTYIYGIGEKTAMDICNSAGINPQERVYNLTDENLIKIRETIDSTCAVEGERRKRVAMDIMKLEGMGCYRGKRHRKRLPVRGQRTKTNARTRKGKRVTVAGKKQVTK